MFQLFLPTDRHSFQFRLYQVVAGSKPHWRWPANLSYSSSSPVSARDEHLHDLLWFRRSHPSVPTTTASFKPINSYQCAGKNSWLPVNWGFLGRNFIAFFIIMAANHRSTWVHDLSHSCWRQKYIYKISGCCWFKVIPKNSLGFKATDPCEHKESSFFPDLCRLISADLTKTWTSAQRVIWRAHIRDLVFFEVHLKFL